MSKILEKLALRRLRPHVMSNSNFSEFQSAYRSGHSTETALLKVVNDVVVSACDRQVTVFLSLDISAAFDTIDHDILLDRISQDFGIRGTVLSWLQSFVTDRLQYVAIGAEAVCASQLHVRHATGQRARSAVVCHVHVTSRQPNLSTQPAPSSVRR